MPVTYNGGVGQVNDTTYVIEIECLIEATAIDPNPTGSLAFTMAPGVIIRRMVGNYAISNPLGELTTLCIFLFGAGLDAQTRWINKLPINVWHNEEIDRHMNAVVDNANCTFDQGALCGALGVYTWEIQCMLYCSRF